MVVSLLAIVSRCGMHDSRTNGLTCLLGERGPYGGLSADHLGGEATEFQDVQRSSYRGCGVLGAPNPKP